MYILNPVTIDTVINCNCCNSNYKREELFHVDVVDDDDDDDDVVKDEDGSGHDVALNLPITYYIKLDNIENRHSFILLQWSFCDPNLIPKEIQLNQYTRCLKKLLLFFIFNNFLLHS